MSYAWIMLLLAGMFEIFMVLGLKYTDGFTRLWPSVATCVVSVCSFYTLSQAIRILPLGTAYAVWTGIGAVGTAILGMVYFGDSVQIARIFCLLLICVGIIGLKVVQ